MIFCRVRGESRNCGIRGSGEFGGWGVAGFGENLGAGEVTPAPKFSPNPPTAESDYGSIAVILRLGTCPTGMRVTSFIVLISMTDTELACALATYALLLSGVSVTQSGARPTSVDPKSLRAGRE